MPGETLPHLRARLVEVTVVLGVTAAGVVAGDRVVDAGDGGHSNPPSDSSLSW